MKYKKGDRLRIVSESPDGLNWNDKMDTYLGKVMTVGGLFYNGYKMAEDKGEWYWYDSMIAGLASEIPFDFCAWKDKNVCMHCRTREEAEDFCNEMHKAGLTWSSGISYLKMKWFSIYENNTCYCFNEGVYGDIKQAKNKGYTILEWSDYRSTEPKEEREKTMKTKSNDKPLSFKEAMKISKRLCTSMRDVCENCPLSSYNNYTAKPCDNFMMDHPDMAEPILKKWATAHPVKTNMDKLIEVFGEIQKYDDGCKNHCSTIPCKSCNWWQQEYVEPYKEEE